MLSFVCDHCLQIVFPPTSCWTVASFSVVCVLEKTCFFLNDQGWLKNRNSAFQYQCILKTVCFVLVLKWCVSNSPILTTKFVVKIMFFWWSQNLLSLFTSVAAFTPCYGARVRCKDALYERRDSDRSSMGHLSSTDRRDGLRKSGEPVAFTVSSVGISDF